MEQSKLESLLEAYVNLLIGFFASTLIWMFIVAPLWGIEMTIWDDFGIVGIFTISSLARSYTIRRFFNSRIHKMVHKVVKFYLTRVAVMGNKYLTKFNNWVVTL